MVSLLKYLLHHTFPEVHLHLPESHTMQNTSSRHFHMTDICTPILKKRISDLDVTHAVDQLTTDLGINIPPPISQLHPIRNEPQFQVEVVNRTIVRHLQRSLQISTRGKMSVKDGNAWPGNRSKGKGKPDVSVFHWDGPDTPEDKIQMRLPVEAKLSWTWCPTWRQEHDADEKKFSEYHQVLSQIHYYMNRWNCKYGGILTEKGLVVVERLKEKTEVGSYGCVAV
jgi:hypothetical protein